MEKRNNIEFLTEYGMLGDIRQRCGAKDENDPSQDDQINAMSARDLAKKWAGWHIGDESWATEIIDLYENATKEARPTFTAAIGDLRVWYIINMPSEPVHIPVSSVEEAMRVITRKANQQLKDSRIVTNMFGLEIFQKEDSEALFPTWNEWESPDGEDINDYERNLEIKKDEK